MASSRKNSDKGRKVGRPPLGAEKLIKLSVQLSQSELEWLQKKGEQEERSISYLIRKAVQGQMEKDD